MAIFRINLADTFDYTFKRNAFSAPTKAFMLSKGSDDNVGYSEVEKIRKGDLLLLCRGIRKIQATALAIEDCIISDVDAYSDKPVYFEKGFRLIKIELISTLWDSVDGEEFFNDLIDGSPFSQGAMGFCFRVYPHPEKIPSFSEKVTSLLQKR